MKTLVSLTTLGLLSYSALAGMIVPTSYSFSPPAEGQAQGGSYNYFDDTGKQLTDGITGVNAWDANLGNGPAYEWVGWLTANPTISFKFGSSVSIREVTIGFNRAQYAGIYIPPEVVIGGTIFTLSRDAMPDNTRGWLSFDGNWTGTSLDITFKDTRPLWTFIDEVKFDGPVVPEPTTVLAGALLLLPFGVSTIRSLRRKV